MDSHEHKTGHFMATTVLLCCAMLAGCSSTGSISNLDKSGEAVGSAVEGGVFSNINELDYNASPEEARIASGDMLDIKVFQAEELSGKVRVDTNGEISLPLIGVLNVAGATPIDVEKKLKTMLGKKYLQDPQVTVFMESLTNQRVTLEGQMKKPGVYPIAGSATLLQAIAMGEGLSDLADPTKIVLFRRSGDQTKAYNLNVNAIRDGKMRDPYVRGDDRIVVHRSDSRYWLRETATLLSPLSVLNSIVK